MLLHIGIKLVLEKILKCILFNLKKLHYKYIVALVLALLIGITIYTFIIFDRKLDEIHEQLTKFQTPIVINHSIYNKSLMRDKIRNVVRKCNLTSKKIIIVPTTFQNIQDFIMLNIWSSEQLSRNIIFKNDRFIQIYKNKQNQHCDIIDNAQTDKNTFFWFQRNIYIHDFPCFKLKNVLLNKIDYLVPMKPRYISYVASTSRDFRLQGYTYNVILILSEKPISKRDYCNDDSSLWNNINNIMDIDWSGFEHASH